MNRVRVKKARRSSVLACGHPVTTGQQIVKPEGGQWVCMSCHLGTLDDTFLRQLGSRTRGARLKTVPPLDYEGEAG